MAPEAEPSRGSPRLGLTRPTCSSVAEGVPLPSVRVHPCAPRDRWRAVLAADPLALPEHPPEWGGAGWAPAPLSCPEHPPEGVDAVSAVGPFAEATRLYEFADGRQFVLP